MKSQSSQVSRRRFLRATAASVPAVMLAEWTFGQNASPGGRRLGPNEKLNLAFIGAGGRGADNLAGITAAESVNVVALCDVDEARAAESFRKFPSAKKYRDFRQMLDAEKSIDAVVVSTPDHVHAVAAMAAIHHGKSVYCEKPLTHTVREARELTLAARAAKVATQMANQGMEFEGNRLINEWIDAGVIGAVREVHVWSDRPTHRGKLPLWWPQGVERPKDTPAVPPTLDWDLWLGPAPWRPFNPAYVPFKWRGWWDFGSGGLGDMGIHNLAPVFSALKLTAPTSLNGSSTPVFPDTVPLANVVHYEFPARGALPPVTVHWYDGGMMPPRPDELEDGRELNREDGIIFVGDKGKMLVDGWGGEHPRLLPASRHKDFQRPPKTLPRSVGHYKEWLNACKTGSPTRSNFDFAGPLTEAVQLGMVCVRMEGARLEWDSSNLKVTNDAEANRWLNYEYRKGWSL